MVDLWSTSGPLNIIDHIEIVSNVLEVFGLVDSEYTYE